MREPTRPLPGAHALADLALATLLVLLTLGRSGPALAQTPEPPPSTAAVAPAAAPAPRAKDVEGFEPVSGDMMDPGESLPASRLVGAAYGFIFCALVVYVASVVARARRVEGELEELRRRIEDRRG